MQTSVYSRPAWSTEPGPKLLRNTVSKSPKEGRGRKKKVNKSRLLGAAHFQRGLRVDASTLCTGAQENCCGHVNTMVQPKEEWLERPALTLEVIRSPSREAMGEGRRSRNTRAKSLIQTSVGSFLPEVESVLYSWDHPWQEPLFFFLLK